MKKVIIIGSILISISICCILCALTAFVFNRIKNADEYYKPKFSQSDAEYVYTRNNGQRIYIKLSDTSDIKVGDKIDSVTVISASTLNYNNPENGSTNDSKYYTIWDYEVVEVEKNYVVIKLNPTTNPDCIGVYIDNEPIFPINEVYLAPSVPGPSDNWMCSYFDFEAPLSAK